MTDFRDDVLMLKEDMRIDSFARLKRATSFAERNGSREQRDGLGLFGAAFESEFAPDPTQRAILFELAVDYWRQNVLSDGR